MPNKYLLSLNRTVVLRVSEHDLLLVGSDGNATRLTKPGKALKTLLTNLIAGGMTADQLCAVAAWQDDADLARLYYAIATFEKKGFVCYTLCIAKKNWATLEPVSPAFCMENASPIPKYRLSRFACLRRLDDKILVESPLGHARIVLHDSRAAAAVSLLAKPHAATELATLLAGLDVAAATGMLSLLCSAGIAFACTADGRIAEDDNAALQQWEFHDLLFHSRSRTGRHDYPLGGTFRFRGALPHPPAVKPAMSERRIALYKPDMKALAASDSPFSRVSESRGSIRGAGEQPLSARELGEFLYRSARVKSINPADPANPADYERSWRVCSSGGAMHELELYLTIARCDGIGSGLYHYDPLDHALEHLADLGLAQQAVLADGCRYAGLQTTDVLITLAARFQRTSWKYQSMAYALILKNVGALYQQMYLVATAMHLAPCGLGGGDSDQFAKATGLDYYTETSVGEFLLSSRLNADAGVQVSNVSM
ncbi:MAG: SagB family peptide dehydrogenase [Hydrogenophaga sp.]|nr:SagB family peptide dehydrogenase [Hydrogenophaga sp.]